MKNISIYILVLFACTQSSCKKDLNALPSNAKVEGNVVVDTKSAQIALNGAYFQLAGVGLYGPTKSGYFERRHECPGAFLIGNLAGYDDGLASNTANYITTFSNFVGPMWVNFYQLINAANGVLKGMAELPAGKIPDTAFNRISGEAHFLRAYGHFCLLMYYAQFFDVSSDYGVLLRKEFVTTDNIVQGRNTVKESYDYIIADLDTAIGHAPVENPSYYASTWAAKALKARVLINRGAVGDYTQVISLTQDVMENGGYALEENQKDIFYTKGLDSKEVILGIQSEPNQVIKQDDYLNYPEWNATQQMIDLLQGDPRSEWVAGPVVSPYYGGDPTLCVTKYAAAGIGETSYILRLSEMYLMQAEAIVRSGGALADAKTLLKTVMSKAGVTNFTSVDNASSADDLLLQIHEEVIKNLCYEDGVEWFSLLRFPFEQVQAMRPTIISKDQYILPIPQPELVKNGKIKQNPGYPAQ